MEQRSQQDVRQKGGRHPREGCPSRDPPERGPMSGSCLFPGDLETGPRVGSSTFTEGSKVLPVPDPDGGLEVDGPLGSESQCPSPRTPSIV